MKDLMNFEHRWKLLDWIDKSNFDWNNLSQNPNAMYLVEKNLDKINLVYMYGNKSEWAVNLLSQNHTKIRWDWLSANPFAIGLLKKNIDASKAGNAWPEGPSASSQGLHATHPTGEICKIDWNGLSSNPSKEAIYLLENHLDASIAGEVCEINWFGLSWNPSAMHILEQNMDKIDWTALSCNPSAVYLLEQNQDKINWKWLSLNPNPKAIYLLEQNIDKINWYDLSSNPSGIHILQQNMDKICWHNLSRNPSEWAIHLLKENQDKIDWCALSLNPSIFELDYDFFHQRMNLIREELIARTWHPSRYEEWCL